MELKIEDVNEEMVEHFILIGRINNRWTDLSMSDNKADCEGTGNTEPYKDYHKKIITIELPLKKY